MIQMVELTKCHISAILTKIYFYRINNIKEEKILNKLVFSKFNFQN